MRNKFVIEYLSFTKKERTGIIILLGFILICVIAPFLYPYFIHDKVYDHSQFDKQISQLKIQQADSSSDKKFYSKNFDENNYNNYYEPSERNYSNLKSEVFYFDPNTASANDWKRLGLKDKTITTIQKYISKGGHFYKPEDIRKIWGIRPELQDRLLPYVRIENQQKQYSSNYNNKSYSSTYEKPAIQAVDINVSDTSALIALPGIGSKLAQRIITFRDKLGGFYSVDQIKETYGLPDSTFQKIKSKLILTNTSVKKININTATIDEMKVHPYIRYNLANAFFQYRTQHGNFSSVADIKKIMIMTDEIYSKISPYLTVR
jgi:competence ComEA-like helix-hairpin-helix protein